MVEQLTLNSFVRRTQHTDQLKQLITSCGASLSRKGRSRNWLLKLTQEQALDLSDLIYQSNQESWYWLAKQLEQNKAQLSIEDLLVLAKSQPSITVNELMSKTDCTLSEARQVLDELEWQAD